MLWSSLFRVALPEPSDVAATITRPNLMPVPRPMSRLALGLLLALLLGGCATVRTTDPQRTATEQMLLSHAADRAIQQLSTASLQDRTVYVDTRYFASIDDSYVVGELRAHLLEHGVRLQRQREEAEVVLEVRTGGIGIDKYNYLLGLPPIFLPAGDEVGGVEMGNGTVITPELALIKRIRQLGYASVGFVAYWRDTGELVASSGPFVGRTRREDWWFFGWGPKTSGDIPTAEAPETD
jgi:uncharacterized protein YceK